MTLSTRAFSCDTVFDNIIEGKSVSDIAHELVNDRSIVNHVCLHDPLFVSHALSSLTGVFYCRATALIRLPPPFCCIVHLTSSSFSAHNLPSLVCIFHLLTSSSVSTHGDIMSSLKSDVHLDSSKFEEEAVDPEMKNVNERLIELTKSVPRWNEVLLTCRFPRPQTLRTY